MKTIPFPQPINSPIGTSQKLQPVASFTRRREKLSPFPFPDAQVFQQTEHFPIQVTRDDPNMESENQDSVTRFFRRKVIEYLNYRTIPGTVSEEMAEKFSWYKDEPINNFQRTFDHLGKYN
ncbi:hypothetical protein O181_009753 [Austropuccinia psidii MF-1]|uniref:Uncharacterized protein n=1 Tax=Austropuccinia psidii MF-1 TaxID=1389203 RepID=A0A9Q3BRZ1_9BASI|nr:hypothetical protein [Austropuccinia psidii MF-1]